MVKIVIIEGLISSGKTTLGPALVEYFQSKGIKSVFVKEPIEKWKNSGKLKEFYSDIQKYAFDFHMYTLESMYEQLSHYLNDAGENNDVGENDIKDTVFVCERSIFSVKYMFFDNLIDLGFITPKQIEEFDAKYNEYLRQLPKPDLFIWLDTPVNTCMERIKKRNRENEATQISEEYQHSLWDKHNNFFEMICKDYTITISPQISLDYRNKLERKSHEENFFEHVYNLIFP